MNWMCKIFGHKYIGYVSKCYIFAGFTRITKLDEPRCKRCGKRMNEK